MSLRHFSILLLLAALWGASFLFIRVAAPEVGPVMLVELRVTISFLALFLYAWWIRKTLSIRKQWKQYVLLGAINAAIPFVFISFSEVYIPASLAAILNATTPLFSALIAAIWLQESLTFTRIFGLVLGLVGVIVLVGWSPLAFDGFTVLAIFASLMAALLYAIGSIYAKKRFQTSTLELAIGQLMGASIFLTPASFFFVPDSWPHMESIISILALSLASTAFAYLLYFRLLKEVGPTQTLYVTILAPAFGVIWSVLFLNEAIGIGTILGLALIFGSVLFLIKSPSVTKDRKTQTECS